MGDGRRGGARKDKKIKKEKYLVGEYGEKGRQR